MTEISASPWFLSAWAYADAAHRNVSAPRLCATYRETALPGRGPGLGADSVPYHQLTFCPVDSPEPTRSTPSPAIRSTTTRTATSGSSSEWSGSTRARPSRSRGWSSSARGASPHPQLGVGSLSRTRPSRWCRSGCRGRTAVITARKLQGKMKSIRPHRRRSLSQSTSPGIKPTRSAARRLDCRLYDAESPPL